MSVLRADYFDGKSSRRQPVTLLIARDRMKIVGRDVDLEVDARRVRRSLRVADTPRWFYLPGGGACVTADNDAVDRITRTRRYERLLHRWESRPAYAALAVLLVAAAAWLLLEFGLPAAAGRIAEVIPPQAEANLGREALQGLERQLMQPSALSESRQKALRARFAALAREAGDATPYQLEFRASRAIGPNAFALPSGIIVVTDELVKLAKRDEEVLAVLAHELGHVRHRHTMRRLLEGSATALVIAAITGDVSSAAALASAVPALLLQTKYSRDNEREADDFAIALLQKGRIEPRHLAAILARMEQMARGGRGIPGFLSTHPETKEREARARAHAQAPAQSDAEEAAPRPEPRRLSLQLPLQREIAGLLASKDFEGLERVLGGLQAAFERDASDAWPLAGAYRTFAELPDAAGAALDEWVQGRPGSYAARAARGRFLLSRGPDLIVRARADLEASLAMTARPYASRLALLEVARHGGNLRQKREWYEAAARLAPQDPLLRIAHMGNIEPRRGGSLKEMDDFAAEARAELRNPRDAAMVAALPPAYRGRERAQANDWSGALRHYDESLGLHAEAGVLCDRSQALSMLKRHDEALADVRRALATAQSTGQPTLQCLDRAVEASLNVNDPNEAVEVLDAVLTAEPGLVPALNQRAWALQETGRRELAFQDLLASAKLGDGWAQMQVGIGYHEGNGVPRDVGESIAWLEKAVEQDVPNARRRLELVRKDAGR